MAYDRALQSYRKTRVETADPVNLVVICYDEAIQAIRQARIHYEKGDFENKGKQLIKAQQIIGELLGSLDREKGGQIAINLMSLYSYMLRRLTEGDLEGDMSTFGEVANLLSELSDAWRQIASDGKAKTQLPSNYKARAVGSREITA